jgi:hypothetical protein
MLERAESRSEFELDFGEDEVSDFARQPMGGLWASRELQVGTAGARSGLEITAQTLGRDVCWFPAFGRDRAGGMCIP